MERDIQLPKARGPTLGYIFMLAAALGFSFKSIFIKMLYARGLDLTTILGLRLYMSLPLFFIALYLREGPRGLRIGARELSQLSLAGLLGLFAPMILTMTALKTLDASLATILIFSYPLFTVLILGRLNRSIPPRQLLAIGIALPGLALVLRLDHWEAAPLETTTLIGIGAALLAALCFACYNVACEKIFHRTSPLRLAAFGMLGPTLLFAINGAGFESLPNDWETWGIAAMLAILCGFFPFVFFLYGIRRIGAGPGTITNSLGPAMTTIWAYLLLGEERDAVQLLGIAIVITGVMTLRLPVGEWLQRLGRRRIPGSIS